MAAKKRIIWIDQLKGIAFFSVILGHMSIKKGLNNWIYSFHMPLFFMLSGYTLSVKKVYSTSFKDYVSNLAKRTLVPYLWLQMLSFLLRYLVNILGRHKEVPVPKYFLGILAGNSNIVSSPSNPLYYVLLLFLAQVGLWCVIKIAKGNKGSVGAMLSFLAVISVLLERTTFVWHINTVPTAMLLIYIGRLIMDCYIICRERLHQMRMGSYLALCLGLFAAGYALSVYNGRISIGGNFYGKDYVIFVAGAVCTSVAFSLVVRLLPLSKMIKFIGMNTFFYMGIHKPLLLVLETVFGKYESHPLFLVLASLGVYFGLAPVAWLCTKICPYICGTALKKPGILTSLGKFVAIAAAGAVPWLYFNNHFMDGILRSSQKNMIISAVIYLVIVVVLERVFSTFMPFMFLQEKPKPKKSK